MRESGGHMSVCAVTSNSNMSLVQSKFHRLTILLPFHPIDEKFSLIIIKLC